MKIKELLNDRSKWTKGWYARDSFGADHPVDSQYACKFCLSGAVLKCYSESERQTIYNKLMKAIKELYGLHLTNVPMFNDSSNTTFEMVRAVIKKADV